LTPTQASIVDVEDDDRLISFGRELALEKIKSAGVGHEYATHGGANGFDGGIDHGRA
jgi:hypothetical protein